MKRIPARPGRARAFNMTVLATTYVEDDVETACAVGVEALSLAATLQSRRVWRYIGDLRRRLERRHRSQAVVRGFTEQFREVFGVG